MAKDGSKKIFVVVAAVIILVITAVAFCVLGDVELVLYDGKTGEVYGSFPIYEGMEFSVEFVHSVNKSPVIDVFVIRDGKIFADRTVYSAFGAGVQTEIGEGQTLTYDEQNRMVVSGFDIEFPKVKYIVGTVSDHILKVDGGEEISLRELCGKNSRVIFEIK